MNIVIAIIGGLINMILSLLIPSLLKNTTIPLFTKINTIYNTNKQLIITSSIIVAITIYIALTVGPSVDNIISSWMENNTPNNNVRFMNLSKLGCSAPNNNFNSNNFLNNPNNNFSSNNFLNNRDLQILLTELSSDM